MNNKKKLIILTGPTGIGKTDLSIDLALALETEIISCDSRQMYRELVIGTAPPDEGQLAKVKHHFVGHLSIHDFYSAGRYELEVLALLDELFKTRDKVLMVGGSGLYIDALINGIDDLPTIDPAVREKLWLRLVNEGFDKLKEELKTIDPEYYHLADLNNPKRVMKALEVFTMTGRTYSSFRTGTSKKRPFEIILTGLQMEREKLYHRIDMRVDKMLEAGLENEALSLYPFKYLNALNTVGYKEFFEYFEGKYDRDEAIRLIKRNSRHYAKRQITWFNRYPQMHWFNREDEVLIKDFLTRV
jgi:tRNA dimethylallyltransferase